MNVWTLLDSTYFYAPLCGRSVAHVKVRQTRLLQMLQQSERRMRNKGNALCAATCGVPPRGGGVCGMMLHANMNLLLCPIRSDRDLHGGQRSGQPVWSQERLVRRDEQPREVIRNGRYDLTHPPSSCRPQTFYCPIRNHESFIRPNNDDVNRDGGKGGVGGIPLNQRCSSILGLRSDLCNV